MIMARKKLEQWLKWNRRSRASLARELAVADFTVKRWIRGDHRPSGKLAVEVERVTGIPATDWWAE